MRTAIVAPATEDDLASILAQSRETFGKTARQRYVALLTQAITEPKHFLMCRLSHETTLEVVQGLLVQDSIPGGGDLCPPPGTASATRRG